MRPGWGGPPGRYPPFPRRQPGWWPAGEHWPPPGWRRPRGPFMWRAGAFFIFMLGVGGAACIGTLWLLGLLGDSGPPSSWVAVVLGGLVLLAVLGGLRRAALPLGDLIAAAGRVEEGDYSTRVTARGEESDRLVGLELGADDYVVKPFSPKELVARVRAVLRRAEGAAVGGAEILRVADLMLDLPRMRLTVGGRPLELTTTEFQLLAALARQPGRIFTRAQLLEAVHGVAFESYERAIDTHIKNLRRKIEPDPRQPRYVLTVYGVGYRLAEP